MATPEKGKAVRRRSCLDKPVILSMRCQLFTVLFGCDRIFNHQLKAACCWHVLYLAVKIKNARESKHTSSANQSGSLCSASHLLLQYWYYSYQSAHSNHWLAAAVVAHNAARRNKAACHCGPKLASAQIDLYFCCIRSADITWLNARIGKQSFSSMFSSPSHRPTPVPWGDRTGLLALTLD